MWTKNLASSVRKRKIRPSTGAWTDKILTISFLSYIEGAYISIQIKGSHAILRHADPIPF